MAVLDKASYWSVPEKLCEHKEHHTGAFARRISSFALDFPNENGFTGLWPIRVAIKA